MGATESILGILGAVGIAWASTSRLSSTWSLVLIVVGVVLIALAMALVVGKLWSCERNLAKFQSLTTTCVVSSAIAANTIGVGSSGASIGGVSNLGTRARNTPVFATPGTR